MARRSTLPNIDGLDPDLARFIEKIDLRRLPPVSEVAALTTASTTVEIAAALQALTAQMRLTGAMEDDT